ncbi:LLM class flavin-dependent oxidoreductase [Gordonia sp. PKS22-38]|uniref:LLM class flavin-dependent oxidoreductase n=1 Tax=Gordonia prachuapensis TaxID=3115651 RepID=A0ABU7MY90_9ACTN|nr:LLM class flavin-dependent oxidoreductase [Gordonia sp. PKS22-38]
MVWFGAHLPLIGHDRTESTSLERFVDAARDLGFSALGANDHVVFSEPWLDGMVALSSVVERSADLTLVTTVALPVIRGPAMTAKAAVALDILSEGRLVLGVGPGSSSADYASAGIPFDQRWPRFDESVRVLRRALTDPPGPHAGRFYDVPVLEPAPARTIPIWVGSWGSAAGLRRAVALGDGWLASAYNTSPQKIASGRDRIRDTLRTAGRDDTTFPTVIATMWTYITDSAAEAAARVDELARMLRRDPTVLGDHLLIGPAEVCAARLARYADVGVAGVFIWPVDDPVDQLRHFGTSVAPLVG